MRAIILGAVAVLCLGAGHGARAASVDLNLSFGGPVYGPGYPGYYMWNGGRYCWYDGGWHGPGFYWCGYRWRRGEGWGGPWGWNGWRYPRHYYRGYYQPHRYWRDDDRHGGYDHHDHGHHYGWDRHDRDHDHGRRH